MQTSRIKSGSTLKRVEPVTNYIFGPSF